MVIFVSGIGTGVGKTVVTGAMARELRDAGYDVITVKMVQTGCVGSSEDLEVHRKMMGVERFPEDDEGLTAPQIFAYPASAELAARLDGAKVDVDKIVSSINKCAERHEIVLVESAGGLMVPLDDTTLTIDVAMKQNWPLVLVTNGALGSINHTILSLEAAVSRAMKIDRVVYNWSPDVPPEIDEDTPKAITRWLAQNGINAPVIRFGHQPSPATSQLSTQNSQLSTPNSQLSTLHSPLQTPNSPLSTLNSPLSTLHSQLSLDRTHIWHPYASLKDPPPVRLAVGASGVEIETAEGKRLIDAVSSWWCVAHGHNHPAITEAIRRQSEKLSHVMFGGFTHEPAIALAERLAKLAPPGLDRVFFADSGSISVEVAVKMATQYQHAKGRVRRTKMLSVKGGYHGDTACAMALSDPDGMHTLFAGMMPRHFFADKPLPWERGVDLSSLRAMVAEHRDEIAGLICEPILQAANAMNIYDAEYLREMRKLANENDFVLVFDEIATGLHRTGPRWAHERAGISPDVMCVGKALTGGHITLAATLASAKVADTISSGAPSAFMHGPTYMANPLACAAACASLELFEHSDYAAKVARIEAELRGQLDGAKLLPNVADVRVIGAVGIIEIKRMPARDDIERVIDEHGVWLRPFSNFIYTMPPLVSDSATIRRITAAMFDLASAEPGPEIDDGGFHE